MPYSTGYAVAGIAALTTINSSELPDGYLQVVKEGFNGEPDLFLFDASSELNSDGARVIAPDDNPPTGRHIKVGIPRWRIVGTGMVVARAFDKILIASQSAIDLPDSPNPGDEVLFLNTVDFIIPINLVGNNYKNSSDYQSVELVTKFKAVALVYANNTIGWVPASESDFVPVTSSSGGGGVE